VTLALCILVVVLASRGVRAVRHWIHEGRCMYLAFCGAARRTP
jgi:hypothetical protein